MLPVASRGFRERDAYTLSHDSPHMNKKIHFVSPMRALGAALFDHGLRVRADYDELLLAHRDFELRLHATEKADGCTLHCFVSIPEPRLAAGSLVLFNEIALEGYPAVAFGAGRGKVTFEFAWFHPVGADWRISADRCQGLIDRVVSALSFPDVRKNHSASVPRQAVA